MQPLSGQGRPAQACLEVGIAMCIHGSARLSLLLLDVTCVAAVADTLADPKRATLMCSGSAPLQSLSADVRSLHVLRAARVQTSVRFDALMPFGRRIRVFTGARIKFVRDHVLLTPGCGCSPRGTSRMPLA